MKKTIACLSLSLTLLAGCAIYDPTPKPDYSIKVMPTANGMSAIPPECPSWAKDTVNPYDAQPLPQFGCATARNLALMIERPEDLTQGRDFGTASGVTTVGAMRRYNNNQTRGLIYPSSAPDTAVDVTTAPTPTSPMTGEVTNGSSSAAAPAAASP